MSLLPEKLSRTQERARRFFPADNAAPLVVKFRKVSVRMDYMRIMLAEKRFRSRSDAKFFLKFFASSVSHPCDFGSKTLNVVFFLLKKTLGNEHRHINVFMPRSFESRIEILLNIFPDRITVRSEYDASLDGRIVHEFRFKDDVRIPFSKIFVHRRYVFYKFFSHCAQPQ